MLAYRAKTPEDFVAKIIESIKSSEVEQTLLVLPFDYAVRIEELERFRELRLEKGNLNSQRVDTCE